MGNAGRLIRIDNTKQTLLAMLDQTPLRVGTIVRHLYKNSRQPEKKARTFEIHLRQLERAGRVRQCDGVWFRVDANPHNAPPNNGGRRLQLAS